MKTTTDTTPSAAQIASAKADRFLAKVADEEFSVRFSDGDGAALTITEAVEICRRTGLAAEALAFETEDRIIATIDANGNVREA